MKEIGISQGRHLDSGEQGRLPLLSFIGKGFDLVSKALLIFCDFCTF